MNAPCASSSRTLIKWCIVVAVLSMIGFPLGIFGLAVWKYRTDEAAQAAGINPVAVQTVPVSKTESQ
jgi:hypothetical protein